MNLLRIVICIILITINFALTYENVSLDMETLMEYSWRLSEASNKFGFDLLTSMATQKSKNLLFSPISLSTTLGLLYHGSRGNTEKVKFLLGIKLIALLFAKYELIYINCKFTCFLYLLLCITRAYLSNMASWKKKNLNIL